jgi:hypothetical protein
MRSNKVFRLLLIVALQSTIITHAQESPINLIAFKYNGMEESSEIIQWEANSPSFYRAAPTEVSSILVGSSIFNPNTGDYIARVTHTQTIARGSTNTTSIQLTRVLVKQRVFTTAPQSATCKPATFTTTTETNLTKWS